MKVKIIVITLAALLLSACGGAPAQAPQEVVTLKMTISEQISYAPILIARAEGYFDEYGINIEYVPFGRASEATALLISGEIDVYAGTLNSGFLNSVYESNAGIKAVADRGHISKDAQCTYYALLVRKDLYESGQVIGPADLAGLTFSGQTAGTGAYFVSTYLALGGLTFDDVNMTDLPTPAEIEAMANKAIDITSKPEPGLTQHMQTGNTVMLARAEDVIDIFQSGVIAFGKKLLVDQPEVGARFMAGYLKGVQQYNQGKTDRNLEILSDATGDSIENLKAYCWVQINNDGSIDFAGVDGFQQWSISYGHMDNPVSQEQFWEPRFIQEAQKLIKP